jgi:hypothetical protein
MRSGLTARSDPSQDLTSRAQFIQPKFIWVFPVHGYDLSDLIFAESWVANIAIGPFTLLIQEKVSQ